MTWLTSRSERAWKTPLSLRAALLASFVLFAVVGARIVDDYGVSLDEPLKHQLAVQTAAYVLDGDETLLHNWIRSDGIVFELGLLAMTRLLGLEDSRDVYLGFHMMSHLFFLLSGIACAILSFRVTGSRAAACVAFLVFVLHPRLYAHSFFNYKDVPFLGFFMISLLLVQRAFHKDTLLAFALCGACLSLAFNVRIMAFVLVLAVLGMRGLDCWFAESRAERRHVLATAGVFLATAAALAYATWPQLWADPVAGLVAALRWMLKTFRVYALFEGDVVWMGDVPRRYVPKWFAMTTPLPTLLLGLAGTIAALARLRERPGEALRNTPARFECLCLLATWGAVAALVAVEADVYHAWRPVYFLFAPFAVLAALGAQTTLAMFRARAARTAAAVAALTAASSSAVATAETHPYQNVYFNALLDRRTPERLGRQYDMDYWATSYREGMEHLLKRHPDANVHVSSWTKWHVMATANVLPDVDRERLIVGPDGVIDYYVTNHREYHTGVNVARSTFAPVVYSRRVYESTIMSVAALNVAAAGENVADEYRKALQAAVAGTLVAEEPVQIFVDDLQLHIVQPRCPRRMLAARIDLRIQPWSSSGDPAQSGGRASDEWSRMEPDFGTHGALIDGICWITTRLPWRPRRLRLRAYMVEGIELWRTDVVLGRESVSGGMTCCAGRESMGSSGVLQAPRLLR